MKLSDLRPCDRCRGPLVRPPANWFWVVRVSGAMVAHKAKQVLELSQVFGGSLEFAEKLSADTDVVTVAGDVGPGLQTELLLCMGCYAGELPLAELVQQRKRPPSPSSPEEPEGPEAA